LQVSAAEWAKIAATNKYLRSRSVVKIEEPRQSRAPTEMKEVDSGKRCASGARARHPRPVEILKGVSSRHGLRSH
jgi:hypothetical protein